MYQYLVLVNTRTNQAYATGNQKCKQANSKQKNYEIVVDNDPSNNKNYSIWARTFKSINEFDYKFFFSDSAQDARSLANGWITQNNWSIYSIKTRPTKVK
jgi:hypothetical protein